MKKYSLWAMLFAVTLLFMSCERKQNLFEKAFEGKTWDAEEKAEQVEAPEKEDDKEEEKKPEPEQLVRDHIEEPQDKSVFLPDRKEERPKESPFKHDPDAPQINLEEAKIYELIHSLCEILKVNYIIDPSVSDQTITIGMVEGETKMKTSELFDLLLKLHDLTWVQEAGFIRIVPLDSQDVIPGLNMLYGTKANKHLFQEELVMQIIPLKYVTPADMGTIIQEFLSPSAKVLEEPKHNALILIEKAHFLRKIMDIIPLFDVSALYNKKMVLYNLQYVDAVEMASQLQEILEAYGYTAESEQVSIHAIEALNSLLVISTFRDVFGEISFWLEKLDQEAQFEEPTIFVYNVQNTTADNLSSTLSALMGIGTSQPRGGVGTNRAASQRRTTNPTGNAGDSNTAKGGSMAASTPQNYGGTNQMGQSMIVDTENNSIIFHTTPKEYQKIRKMLEKLDVLPRQVFLEVTIFSVDLKNSFSLGFDWTGQNGITNTDDGGENITTTVNDRNLTIGSGSTTFNYSYTGLTEVLTMKLNAAKTKGYANVLQQPHMMAIDNKPATISIGTDVPIETQRTTLPGQTTDPVYQPYTSSNVQYRKTGVSLTVTPHINANGLIRMEIELSISSPGGGSTTGAPPINQNDLATEMIVRDGQTVVMGGMISDTENGSRDSVPLLGKIPLLRHLFTDRTTGTARNELIVMITPKVIDNEEASIRVSKEFSEKIKKEYQEYVFE